MDRLLLTVFCFVLGMVLADAASGAEGGLRGGKILLLGDSLLDCHEGDDRIERPMREKLAALHPGVAWEVVNLARGGMWIGPADATTAEGVAEPLFETETTGWYFQVLERCPTADAIIIEFSGNDSKVYPPEVFREKLSALCDRLAKDYPGAKVVLATGMYLDPNHSVGYRRTPSMVKDWQQGESRNKYLRPYFEETRSLAKERGFGLADICARIKAETDAGNWDLRVRSDDTLDASKDAAHVGDLGWFDNIHPNLRGTDVMADTLVKTLLGVDGLKPYPREGCS